jgi:hypothetical protein
MKKITSETIFIISGLLSILSMNVYLRAASAKAEIWFNVKYNNIIEFYNFSNIE